MTHNMTPVGSGSEEEEPTGPVIRDKRRLDPQTGEVRHPASAATAAAQPAPTPAPADLSEPQPARAGSEPDSSAAEGSPEAEGEITPDATLADDLKRDLQRLQAEYVNYKRRVDRDRELHRDLAVGSVIEALLPVLDDIHLARVHGDLETGPFAAIADKLETTLAKFGVKRFGQPGEAFDPMVHEALMHTEAELAEGTQTTTVVQVLQPGYRMGERLIRPARVAVADPQ